MEPWNAGVGKGTFFSWAAQPMSTRVVSIVLIYSGDDIDTGTSNVWEKKQTINIQYTVNKDAHLSIVVIRINSKDTCSRDHCLKYITITSWIVCIYSYTHTFSMSCMPTCLGWFSFKCVLFRCLGRSIPLRWPSFCRLTNCFAANWCLKLSNDATCWNTCIYVFFGVPRSETTKTLMVSCWHLSILKWICRGGRHVIDGYLRAEMWTEWLAYASMHSISGGPQGMVEDYELQGFEEANGQRK